MGTANAIDAELSLVDTTWRAANFLTVGQIYLRANPLLREPLLPEHIKPRLLGHWGTSPGLNLLYAHLNRVIRRTDRSVLFVAGPGHGGPAVVANVWLEGTYSEIYDDVSRDLDGMQRLFRQFSTPGGIPSHVSVPTPGSIHEGGELGYALVHAFGAAFDDPDLLVACVIGDGEAETAPLEGSWKGIKFLNPARDGAVLPILHLNEYKISGPTVLGRSRDEDIAHLLRGHGYDPVFVEGDDPPVVHRALAAALDRCVARIDEIQVDARARGAAAVNGAPAWPALVLRTPKGWTGPAVVDGLPIEGTFRAHQVPVSDVTTNSEHLAILESWMRSYQPEALFDADGRPAPDVLAMIPDGARRMGANPSANGGRVLVALELPDPAAFALPVEAPATERHESTRVLGEVVKDIYVRNARGRELPHVLSRRDELESARRGVRRGEPVLARAPSRPRRPPRARRPDDGGAQRAPLRGLARGLPAHRPARPVRDLRSVRHGVGIDARATRQVARSRGAAAVAALGRVVERPVDVHLLAQRPQRLLAPGTRTRRRRDVEEGGGQPHLPAARRQLPALGGRPLLPQSQLREPDRDRQAAAAAVPRHGFCQRALHPRVGDLGVGVDRRRRRSRRGARVPRATSRRRRRWRRRGSSAGTCPTCASAWSTWST